MSGRTSGPLRGRSSGPEDGGIAIEAAILVPALLLFVLLAVGAGRIESAGGVVAAAARDAARSASIARTDAAARAAAENAARTTLSQEGVDCPDVQPQVDTSALDAPLGQTGYITVTVVCTVPLGDLVVPGLPGSHTMKSTFTSVVDRYRAR